MRNRNTSIPNMRVSKFANLFGGQSASKSYMRLYYKVYVPTSLYNTWFQIVSRINYAGEDNSIVHVDPLIIRTDAWPWIEEP